MRDPGLYAEEIGLGCHLAEHAALFNASNEKLAVISRTYVIVFEVKNGSRLHVFHHDRPVVGLRWNDDFLMTLTQDKQIFEWDLQNNSLKSRDKVKGTGHFMYYYDVGAHGFVLSSDGLIQSLDKLDWFEKTATHCLKLPAPVQKRCHLGVGSGFAVVCTGRLLKVIPFNEESFTSDREFYFGQHFNDCDYNDKIVFESAQVVNNNVYAVLSIGRVYSWQKVNEFGLGNNNRTFFHSHNAEVRVAATALQAIFCGTANCKVDKWNLLTSGRGRYERFHAMERMDAPVDALWLSADDRFLLAVMADNSIVILNSASLAVVSRPQTLQLPNLPLLDWVGLKTDIEYSNCVVTNGRHGYVQWIDPVKWRSIAEENPPSRDSVCTPEFDWANVYELALCSSLLVTCECRRKTPNHTILKLFTRLSTRSINDMKYICSVPLPWRVKFLRLSLEDLKHQMGPKMAEKQYVVLVDENGRLQALHPDPTRQRRWCMDLARATNWHNTKVVSCSTVRDDLFATVNAATSGDDAYVVMWQGSSFTVVDCLDQLPGVQQATWAPLMTNPQLLLLSGSAGIVAFDSVSRTFNWAIEQSRFKLFCTRFVSLAYKDEEVIVFNAGNGAVKSKLQFSHHQDQVVCTGSDANIRLSGLNAHGLALMKPETEENETLRDVVLDIKKTPFSALAQLSRAHQSDQPQQKLVLSAKCSARKLLEGTAYTLAPITKLGPTFVASCLIPRQVE